MGKLSTLEPTAETLEMSPQLRVAGLNGYGFISVSKHGYLVLNANKVFFGDIDCERDPRNPDKDVANFEQAARLVEDEASRSGLTFRVYGTFAGLRLIEVSRLHDPEDVATGDIMRAVGSDPAFIALTTRLKNFRVRLTPKPWRAPEGPEGFTCEGDLQAYLNGSLYAVAHYVGTIGKPVELAGEIGAVVALHDHYCRVNDDLPLA